MYTTVPPLQPRAVRLRILGLVAAVLLVALFVAPSFVAGNSFGGGGLAREFGDGFVEYWNLGVAEFPPRLANSVDYWFRFHVAKAVIAGLLLVVAVALGVRLWSSYCGERGIGAVRRASLFAFGVAITSVALFAGVVLMANVQGAFAPFSSLLSVLPVNGADGDLAVTVSDVRAQLASGRTSPVTDVMSSDFGWYHAVMAVVAIIAAGVLLGTGVFLVRRFVRADSADRRSRRVLGAFGVLSAVLMLCAGVIALANVGTAADPGPALVGFFDGGLL